MRRATWSALVGIALLGAAGCASDDLVGDATQATVGVRAAGCSLVDRLGTGAVIVDGDRTLIVTSAHTVAGSTTVTIERSTQRTEVELLAIDPERDIAVLSAPGWAEPGRPLADPTAGESVRLAVWDPDEPIEVSETTITQLLRVTIEDIYVQGEHERQAFEIDASVVRGDSGAPVIADDGDVLGIVYARSRERGGVAFAVAATDLRAVIADATDSAVDPGRCV